jgi:hypothetical protein
MMIPTGDRVIAYAPGRDFVVEGIRDPATGEFHVTALFRRVQAPPVNVTPSVAAPMLLIGQEAERAIDCVETWLEGGNGKFTVTPS